MEQWAYGASWRANSISKCEEASLISSETKYNPQSLRTLIFMVGISQNKSPTSVYLGATEGLEGSKDKYAYGYLPMNIKLSLTFIDLIEPYIK